MGGNRMKDVSEGFRASVLANVDAMANEITMELLRREAELKWRRWKTWVRHFLICTVISAVAGPAVGGGFYTLREVEQQAPKAKSNSVMDWLGAFGDVAFAWLGAGLAWWLRSLAWWPL